MSKTILILANADGGLYHFRKELLEAFANKGYKIYCSLPFGENIQNITALGCECINTKISRHGTNPLEDFKLFLRYIRLIYKVKPNVVLTYTIKPNIYGGLASRIKKVPYIANITGLGTAIQSQGFIQKLTLTLYRVGLRRAETVFFQNSENQKFMLRKGVVKCKNDLLPGSGVNLEQHRFEEYFNNDKVILLTIGRIMRDKGVDEILHAAEIIKSEYSNVIFRFIGSYDENYHTQFERAVNEGLIEYMGSQPQVHSFITESHATLHASYHEGMSNVLLETAASGRPIIATDVPGCRETFDDGVSGISFKPKNVDDMVRAIKEFLSLSNEQKAEMGKAGRQKMEREFNRDIIVNKYMQIIEKL